MLLKKEEEHKKNLKLQPYLDFWVSEVKMDSFLLPSMYCYGVSLSPCVLLPFSVFSHPLHSLYFPNFPFDSAAFSIFWNVDVLLVDTVHEW